MVKDTGTRRCSGVQVKGLSQHSGGARARKPSIPGVWCPSFAEYWRPHCVNLSLPPGRGQLRIWHGNDQKYSAEAGLGAGGGAWLEHRQSAVSEDLENPASIRQCG